MKKIPTILIADDDANIFEILLNSFVKFFTAQQFSYNKNRKLMGDQYLIRRVIGMPGDSIYMRDHVLYIKPKGEKHFLTEFELIKRGLRFNRFELDNKLTINPIPL